MGLPPVKRPRSAERALELLDTTEEDRRMLSAEGCDDAAVCLRSYAVYADRVYAREAALVRFLRWKGEERGALGAAMKLDLLGQLVPRVSDLARAFENLAHTKRRLMA